MSGNAQFPNGNPQEHITEVSAEPRGNSRKTSAVNRESQRWRELFRWLVLLMIAFALGYGIGYVRSSRRTAHTEHTTVVKATEKENVKWWTCSMHPQIQQPTPGKCPICFMDLIPVYLEEKTPLTVRQIRMTREAVALAEIETAPVCRVFPTREIRLWGRIEFDETRLATISARFAGRLDRLYVDYTGVPVRRNDHLVDIYSPELVVAQQELLQAQATLRSALPGTAQYNLASSLLRSSEEKLRLWGILPEQIDEIKQRGVATDHLTLYAPIAGIVITKHAKEGDYVKTGDPIYSIADLSHVWAVFDAYEEDIPWLRYGQTVEFETDAFPGERFTGQIAFIDPTLRETTRTIRVRVNVANPRERLKPGMLARGLVQAHLAAGDVVFEPTLAGKWICPMHPEVLSDERGKCTRCGMDLVPVESLGYVAVDKTLMPALVIPSSAPLITGKRALVYVRLPGSEEPVFESREIVLGPRVKEGYVVHSGLEEGEQVVVKGNFKIDSAVQLVGKPSMMYEGSGPEDVTQGEKSETGVFQPTTSIDIAKALQPLWPPYFALHEALTRDDAEKAGIAFKELQHVLGQSALTSASETERDRWNQLIQTLHATCDRVQQKSDLETLRSAFRDVSHQLIETARTFGHVHKPALVVVFCPMAFSNQGAEWLQVEEAVANPYFGPAMLRCGEIRERLEPLHEDATTVPLEKHNHKTG